jgi:hypothetical protein
MIPPGLPSSAATMQIGRRSTSSSCNGSHPDLEDYTAAAGDLKVKLLLEKNH